MVIRFNKIVNGDIFVNDFDPFVRYNEISFPKTEEIAVIYGPNGTGKTSLIKTLGDAKDTQLDLSLDDEVYHSGSEVFHIINDQNNRNIIMGETRDFFLGDNIRHEFELQDQVEIDRTDVINQISSIIKNTFGISAGSSPLIELLSNKDSAAFIKDCANSKSKGKDDVAEILRDSITEVLDPEKNGGVLAAQKRLDELAKNMNELLRLATTTESSAAAMADIQKFSYEMKALREFIETEKSKATVAGKGSEQMNAVLERLEQENFTLAEYDDVVVRQMAERITVVDKHTIRIRFIGGMEITQGV